MGYGFFVVNCFILFTRFTKSVKWYVYKLKKEQQYMPTNKGLTPSSNRRMVAVRETTGKRLDKLLRQMTRDRPYAKVYMPDAIDMLIDFYETNKDAVNAINKTN